METPLELSVEALAARFGDDAPAVARLEAAAARLEEFAAPEVRRRAHRVAARLAELALGADVVVAALLAPLPSEHAAPCADGEVAALLERLGRVRGVLVSRARGESLENLRRLFLSLAGDVRVVLVVLAEQVEALAELDEEPDAERRAATAEDALELFAPLANRLGVFQLKWELEDRALRELEPDAYRSIKRLLNQKRLERQADLELIIGSVEAELAAHGLRGAVQGRPKHIYSIYRKMLRKQLDFAKVYDVTAIRVLLETEAECYAVLGLVHGLWAPIPGELDDYVARPKPNGYRSLHTAVVGPGGRPVEVQIRTHAMHRWAEYGVASHWAYKERGPDTAAGRRAGDLARRFDLVRELLEWQREVHDAGELAESLRTDVFDDRVYVFSPKGELFELPRGATPLDFAYRVHTQVGHRCRGAMVNGQIAPLDSVLTSGDRVEILTAREPAPRRDWMNPRLGFLRTAHARAKVRLWFRQQEGRPAEPEPPTAERAAPARAPAPAPRATPASRASERPAERVRVGDVDLLYLVAGCCQPRPGDDVVGYVSRGRGVVIHRRDCRRIPELEAGRLLEVDWSPGVAAR